MVVLRCLSASVWSGSCSTRYSPSILAASVRFRSPPSVVVSTRFCSIPWA